MEVIEAASIDLQTAIADVISGSAYRLGRRGACGSTLFQFPFALIPFALITRGTARPTRITTGQALRTLFHLRTFALLGPIFFQESVSSKRAIFRTATLI